MLVGTARGAAHIIFWVDDPSAACANPSAGVQLVAFQVGVCAQEVLLGFLHIVSSLDARQRKVSISGRVVHTRRVVIWHRRANSCLP
jgi:hypothetical protein